MSIPASFPYYDISRQPIPLTGELATRLSVSTHHIAGRAVGGVAAIHGGQPRKGNDGSSISDATVLFPPPHFPQEVGWVRCRPQRTWRPWRCPWWVISSWQMSDRRCGVVAIESGGTGGVAVGTAGGSGQTSWPNMVATSSEEPTQPFILSEGLAPVLVKFVAKILKGDFVVMAELLRDNLEAQRRGNLQDASAIDLSQSKRACQEIPDLLSWVQCFGTHLAVSATKYPDRLWHLLAYQTLVVRKARQ